MTTAPTPWTTPTTPDPADKPPTAQPAQPRRLALSVPEAAELLGISRALAYELVARGEIPSIRLGWRIVVPRVALHALVGIIDTEAAETR